MKHYWNKDGSLTLDGVLTFGETAKIAQEDIGPLRFILAKGPPMRQTACADEFAVAGKDVPSKVAGAHTKGSGV